MACGVQNDPEYVQGGQGLFYRCPDSNPPYEGASSEYARLRPSSGGAQKCFTHNVMMEMFTPTPNDISTTFKVRIDWFLQAEESFASNTYIVQKSWNHVKIDQKLVDLSWEIAPDAVFYPSWQRPSDVFIVTIDDGVTKKEISVTSQNIYSVANAVFGKNGPLKDYRIQRPTTIDIRLQA